MSKDDFTLFLNQYTDHYKLRKNICFNTFVKNLKPKENGKWIMKTKDKNKVEEDCYEFDAIFVCNGHYTTPKYPTIKGINNFQGKILHSSAYYDPANFKGNSKEIKPINYISNSSLNRGYSFNFI